MTYLLPPLSVPPDANVRALSTDEALQYDAVALFVRKAYETGAGFALTDANAPIVAEICRRLDGIALAIELAAARIRTLTVFDLCRRLNERFAVLVGGSRDALPRHRALRTAFDWSYELLDEQERAFFRRSAVFVGGFSLEAAHHVCLEGGGGEIHALELLAALVDKSLVQPDFSVEETRYRLLETQRAYALQKLTESGEFTVTASRHLICFRDMAQHAQAEAQQSGKVGMVVPLLQADQHNIRAALRWSLSTKELQSGIALLDAIGGCWTGIGHTADGIAFVEEFLAVVPNDNFTGKAALYENLSLLQYNAGRVQLAAHASCQALELARRANQSTMLFRTLMTYGITMALVKHFGESAAALHEAEALAGLEPSVGRRLYLLKTRGKTEFLRGNYRRAAEIFAQECDLRRSIGDVHAEATAELWRAEAEHGYGSTAQAIGRVRDVLDRPPTDYGRETHAMLLANLAGYLGAANDTAGALRAARGVLDMFADVAPMPLICAIALAHAALALAVQGDLEVAALFFGASEEAQRKAGYESGLTEQITQDRLRCVLQRGLQHDTRTSLMSEGAALPWSRVIERFRHATDGIATGTAPSMRHLHTEPSIAAS
ncbi:MAG: hypothetical protein JO043_11140 [Candidatus Eremiobacteraeota bacterium]|nr:hypothetical protein [Candidatus Eremiobacteraeota bacterium]